MAIDDNTLYGLTGAQVKELPERIEAVKGLARVLTTADYNYPTDNPTCVNAYLLPAGVYTAPDNVVVSYSGTNFSMFDSEKKLFFVNEANANGHKLLITTNASGGAQNAAKIRQLTSVTSYNDMGNLLLDGTVVNNLTSTSTDRPLSANQGKVLKDFIDSIAIRGAGAPTTSTVGQVGTLYEDTTNGDLYICTDATNPYVWEEVGAGGSGETTLYSKTAANAHTAISSLDIAGNGTQATPYAPCHFEDNNGEDHWFYVRTNSLLSSGVLEAYVGGYSYDAAESYWGGKKEARLALYSDVPTVVEEPGSSETNVMSQKATTWMIYNGGNATKVQIGANSGATQEWGVAILGTTNQQGTVAIGNAAAATARGAVAIGMGASASTQGVFDIGLSGVGSSAQTNHGYNSSAYRLLTGLYDPQNAHDAATKGYVDTAVAGAGAATFTTNEWNALWA